MKSNVKKVIHLALEGTRRWRMTCYMTKRQTSLVSIWSWLLNLASSPYLARSFHQHLCAVSFVTSSRWRARSTTCNTLGDSKPKLETESVPSWNVFKFLYSYLSFQTVLFFFGHHNTSMCFLFLQAMTVLLMVHQIQVYLPFIRLRVVGRTQISWKRWYMSSILLFCFKYSFVKSFQM